MSQHHRFCYSQRPFLHVKPHLFPHMSVCLLAVKNSNKGKNAPKCQWKNISELLHAPFNSWISFLPIHSFLNSARSNKEILTLMFVYHCATLSTVYGSNVCVNVETGRWKQLISTFERLILIGAFSSSSLKSSNSLQSFVCLGKGFFSHPTW